MELVFFENYFFFFALIASASVFATFGFAFASAFAFWCFAFASAALAHLLLLLLRLLCCFCCFRFCCFCSLSVFLLLSFVHLSFFSLVHLFCGSCCLVASCAVLAAFAWVVIFPFCLLCFSQRFYCFCFLLLCCSGQISSMRDGLTLCPCNLPMLAAPVPLHVLQILLLCLRPLFPCFLILAPFVPNFFNEHKTQKFYELNASKVL